MFYYRNSETGELLEESDLEALYRDALDDAGPVTVAGSEFAPSRVLAELDPIAYRVGFSDWADADGWEETDDEPTDEDDDEMEH